MPTSYIQYNPEGKKVFLIDMREQKDKVLSDLAKKWIQKYVAQGKKILFLINKKGYSAWVVCQDCGYVPKCKLCDVPIAFHKDQHWIFFGVCHVCKTTYQYPTTCPVCQGTNLKPYGVGTQKLAEIIQKLTSISPLIIQSETANSPTKIKKIQEQLSGAQLVIGTSLLTQPPKNWHPDLVIVVNADIGLNVPDFNSNYNNFLFLFQIIKNYSPAAFLVQTFHPEAYSIQHAVKLDRDWFKAQELAYRKKLGYPPFVPVAVLAYKHEIEATLFSKINKIYQDLEYLKKQYWFEHIQLYPTPPLLYKAFGKYRYNIILKGENVEDFLHLAQQKLNFLKQWFQADIHPVNLI